jgi:hypothetical protein
MHNRAAELAEIDRYIGARSPTRCPSAFVAPVTAAFSPRESVMAAEN